MIVYKIDDTVLDRDYRGCGKAWVAIDNGEVKAIRYMNDFNYENPTTKALDFLRYLRSQDPRRTQTFARREAKRIGLVKTMVEFDTMIQSETEACRLAERDAFSKYREASRLELSLLGEVRSGMCSCTEFIDKEVLSIKRPVTSSGRYSCKGEAE